MKTDYSPESFSLKNKVAVITGAGHPQGIGCAVAKKLAGLGAVVILTDIASSKANLQISRQAIESTGGTAIASIMDITQPVEIEETISGVVKRFGQIDILVNNAGVGGGSSQLLETNPSDFELTLQVNLMGAFNCCKAVVPAMLASGGGAIVNVASLCGLGAIPDIPLPYTASKFAVIGFTKALALEFAQNKIRCNAVCPGAVNTFMRDQLFERIASEQDITVEEARILEDETIALGRGGEPEEIADCVAYLVGPGSSYLTGVALPVAGGMAPGL